MFLWLSICFCYQITCFCVLIDFSQRNVYIYVINPHTEKKVVAMTINHNLFTLKRQLEIASRKEYTWLRISKITGIHANTLHNIATNKTRRLDLDIVEKLLDFFASEGMPVTINDLFVEYDLPSGNSES